MSMCLHNGTLYKYVPAMEYDGVFITSIETKEKNLILPEVLLNKNVVGISKKCLDSNSFVENITVPKTYKRLVAFCFQNMPNLKSVNIEADLEANCINSGLFSSCPNLKTVILPNSIELINDRAFYGCKSLEIFTCPEKLRYMGREVFRDSGIKVFNVNKNIDYMPLTMLHYCPCQQINVHPDSSYYTSIDGVLYKQEDYCDKKSDLSLYVYPNSKTNKEYTPPKNVSLIRSSSIIDNPFLEKITFPSSVKLIKHGVVSGCKNLKFIRIKSDNTEIEPGAFDGICLTTKITCPYNYKYESVLLDDKIKPERDNELAVFINNISTNIDKEVSI